MLSREFGDLSEVVLSPGGPAQLAHPLAGQECERPGLVEAAEHGKQFGAAEQRHGVRIRRKDGIERPQGVVGRTRALDER